MRLDGSNRPKVLVVFGLDATSVLEADTVANLKAARQAYTTGDFACVVFTGGIFNRENGQSRPIAQMMATWWRNHAPPSAIVLECSSRTTRESVTRLVGHLHQHGYEVADCEIVAVSEYWHLIGVSLLFRRGWKVRISRVQSDFRLNIVGIIGRILRVPLYLADPSGTGWLSKRESGRRAR